MITRLFRRLFADSIDDDELREPAVHQSTVPPRPVVTSRPPDVAPRSEDAPPPRGEPLIKNRFLREDTGTHETLKILDDSLLDSGEEEGFDPYNTGDFDRSRNWERRFKS